MSNYKTIAETFVTVDEVEGLRKIIGELKAQLAEQVAGRRDADAEAARYHAGAMRDLAKCKNSLDASQSICGRSDCVHYADLERQLAEAEARAVKWQTRAGRLAEVLERIASGSVDSTPPFRVAPSSELTNFARAALAATPDLQRADAPAASGALWAALIETFESFIGEPTTT